MGRKTNRTAGGRGSASSCSSFVGPAIGIILDGTGFGRDGTIWGGEILIGDASGYDRCAYLDPVALPGGAAAIKNPWRMAISYLHRTFGKEFLRFRLPFLDNLKSGDIDIILKMIESNFNSPLTSSCGRLFDAVSAMLDIRGTVGYEAQAAIELEMNVNEDCAGFYEQSIGAVGGRGPIPTDGLVRGIIDDIRKAASVGAVAAKFHRSLAEMLVWVVTSARRDSRIDHVALSGGVFQNDFLFRYLLDRLQNEGFNVITHSQVPCNDGGLALGQVAVGDSKAKAEVTGV